MSAKFNSALVLVCVYATKAYASIDSLDNPIYATLNVS